MADGPAGFTRGYTCPALLRITVGFTILRIRGSHPLRRRFPAASPRLALATSRSYNPAGTGIPAVWALPRSLATTGGITFCFLFLWVIRCFSSPGSPPRSARMTVRQTAGLPHSGTPGSKTACVSPGLFAACRALRRLPEPQASAVRPFLLSPPRLLLIPKGMGAAGRIPWNCFLSRFSTRFSSCSTMSMSGRPKHGAWWRITDSNR